MTDPTNKLTPEDYTQLLEMIKNGDPRGMQAAKNLTPQEQQEFFNFQQVGNKGKDPASNREDSSVAKIPVLGDLNPEDILVGMKAFSPAASAIKRGVGGFAEGLASGGGFWKGIGRGMQKIGEGEPNVPPPPTPPPSPASPFDSRSTGTGFDFPSSGTTKLRTPTAADRALSPGQEAGVQSLDELMNATGSGTKGNGTFNSGLEAGGTPNASGLKSSMRRPDGGILSKYATKQSGGTTYTISPDAGPTLPKNLSTLRTPADVAEQVKGGVSTGSPTSARWDSRNFGWDNGTTVSDPNAEAIDMKRILEEIRKRLGGK